MSSIRYALYPRGIYLLATLALLSLPAASLALCNVAWCSCIGPPGEFLVPTGVQIPADSRGLPFWGHSAVRWTEDGLQPVDPTPFSIDRFVDGRRVRVGVELEVLSGPLITDDHRHRYARLLLVKPRGGFVPENQYLFTYSPRSDRHAYVTSHPRYDPRETLVIVGAEKIADAAMGAEASLEVGAVAHRSMRVSAGASCSVEIDAAAAAITLRLPPRLERWREVLLYTVRVDGREIWKPSTSVCRDIPPGHSWEGRTRELVYAACGPDDEHGRISRARFNLEPGAHDVVMTAWWPGVEASVSAATTVELTCDAVPSPREKP
jgi:hypothetical protein